MRRFDDEELVATTRLDFETHGIHWMNCFSEALDASGIGLSAVGAGRQSDMVGTIFHLRLDGEPLDTTAVRVIPSNGSTEFHLCHRGSENHRILSVLRDAIEHANRSAGRKTENFTWTAGLVQAPHAEHRSVRLSSSIRIGGLTLAPDDTVFSDVVYPGRAFDGNYRVHRSHPIRVTGRTPASSWSAASVTAERTLRNLCGLLALNWAPPYELATSAVNVRDGVPPTRTTRAGITLVTSKDAFIDVWEEHPPLKYGDEPWTRLNETRALQHAVDAYLEARYIEERHKAFALVAYVASIEAIANIQFDRPRNEFITEAFKKTLRLVLPETEARELDRVYTWRSKTVHQGDLRGTGSHAPSPLMDIFAKDTFSNSSSLLPRVGDTSKRLLIAALLDRLPPRQAIGADEHCSTK